MTERTEFQKWSAEQGERVIEKGTEGATILAELSFPDLKRLREAVKRVFMRHYPVEFFTDREADRMIEALAPSVREEMIRRTVDEKLADRNGNIVRHYLS